MEEAIKTCLPIKLPTVKIENGIFDFHGSISVRCILFMFFNTQRHD
jgi:hypothetical protein